MSKDYGFIRQLAISESSDITNDIIKSLRNEGLEVYLQIAELGEFHTIQNDVKLPGNTVIYVTSADREYAEEILTKVGYADYLLENIVPEVAKTEVEKAIDAYNKKRKWTYIEIIVILFIAIIYMFVKSRI